MGHPNLKPYLIITPYRRTHTVYGKTTPGIGARELFHITAQMEEVCPLLAGTARSVGAGAASGW